MSLNEADLKALIELAEKATPGPWRSNAKHPLHRGPCVDTLKGEYICETALKCEEGIFDSNFIGAANPTTVKAMAEELLARREIQKNLSAIDSTQKMLGDIKVFVENYKENKNEK